VVIICTILTITTFVFCPRTYSQVPYDSTNTQKNIFLLHKWRVRLYNADEECSLWGKIRMVLYQTNLILHSGDLSTALITKVSMCRIYGGKIGKGKNILLVTLSLSVSIILLILRIHFHFLATHLRMTSGRSRRTFYESHIISKNTFFPPFEGLVNSNAVSASLFLDLPLSC
jgi:hypothetical protein